MLDIFYGLLGRIGMSYSFTADLLEPKEDVIKFLQQDKFENKEFAQLFLIIGEAGSGKSQILQVLKMNNDEYDEK